MRIDTHCHLSKKEYPNLEEVIARMGDNLMIVSGSDLDSNLEVLELCDQYPNIYGVIGYHPEKADEIGELELELLEKQLCNKKIVGIGEIGLDYYWRTDNKEKQKQVFLQQIDLAKKLHLPIVIHSRDAAQDTLQIVKEDAQDLKIVMHCFSYSLELAKEYVKLGVLLGIGGVLTFQNSRQLKEVVNEVDLAYLLLETDAPYLTPVPFRGTQNEPAYTRYIAEKIGEIKGISTSSVELVTSANAIRQFDLPIKI